MTRPDPAAATLAEPSRRCGQFGCLEPAAWLTSDPQGGQLAACETDVDLLLNDGLARVPLDSSIRIEVWRA